MNDDAPPQTPAPADDRRWLRRSRAVQAIALGVAVVAAIVTISNTASRAGHEDHQSLPVPSSSTEMTPEPSTTPTVDAIAMTATGSASGGTGAGTGPNPGKTLRCYPMQLVHLKSVNSPYSLEFLPNDPQNCGDARVKVFWVSYSVDANRNLTLYGSQTDWLSAQHSVFSFTISLPGYCGFRWYVVAGDFTIPQYVASANVGYFGVQDSGPFWDPVYHYQGAFFMDMGPSCPAPAPGQTSAAPTSPPTMEPTRIVDVTP